MFLSLDGNKGANLVPGSMKRIAHFIDSAAKVSPCAAQYGSFLFGAGNFFADDAKEGFFHASAVVPQEEKAQARRTFHSGGEETDRKVGRNRYQSSEAVFSEAIAEQVKVTLAPATSSHLLHVSQTGFLYTRYDWDSKAEIPKAAAVAAAFG
jgi:hypothetical protein